MWDVGCGMWDVGGMCCASEGSHADVMHAVDLAGVSP
jgi:hypothetical protein